MKQPLWLLNSTLLLILLFSLFLSFFFKQESPIIRKKKAFISLEELEKKETVIINKEDIYKNDIFGTYVSAQAAPVKESLVPPYPELKIPAPQKPTPPKKPVLLAPLSIELKGTVVASDEIQSIAMIADETKKEAIYHVGDKIKDGQLIKIIRNCIVMIRSNGQQEMVYLKKDDFKPFDLAELTLDEIVKKTAENKYQIDPQKFAKKVDSLGLLSEELGLITAYKKGNPIGIKVGQLTDKGIGLALGLQKGDIITSINNIPTTERKNKTQIYDTLTSMPEGKSFKVTINRQGRDVNIMYALTHLEKPLRKEFAPGKELSEQEKLFKMSKLQEREKRVSDFSQQHGERQQAAVDEIRQRLLENMKLRAKNVRIR